MDFLLKIKDEVESIIMETNARREIATDLVWISYVDKYCDLTLLEQHLSTDALAITLEDDVRSMLWNGLTPNDEDMVATFADRFLDDADYYELAKRLTHKEQQFRKYED